MKKITDEKCKCRVCKKVGTIGEFWGNGDDCWYCDDCWDKRIKEMKKDID